MPVSAAGIPRSGAFRQEPWISCPWISQSDPQAVAAPSPLPYTRVSKKARFPADDGSSSRPKQFFSTGLVPGKLKNTAQSQDCEQESPLPRLVPQEYLHKLVFKSPLLSLLCFQSHWLPHLPRWGGGRCLPTVSVLGGRSPSVAAEAGGSSHIPWLQAFNGPHRSHKKQVQHQSERGMQGRVQVSGNVC